jgi:hypothetical protein
MIYEIYKKNSLLRYGMRRLWRSLIHSLKERQKKVLSKVMIVTSSRDNASLSRGMFSAARRELSKWPFLRHYYHYILDPSVTTNDVLQIRIIPSHSSFSLQ